MILEALAATLICLDPGHGTVPSVGAQREPIGPGSRTLKIKDPGGAAGEAPVALAIARRTRALLVARGYRVAMTRERAGYTRRERRPGEVLQRAARGPDDPHPRRRLDEPLAARRAHALSGAPPRLDGRRVSAEPARARR